jgi:hypothetical protein
LAVGASTGILVYAGLIKGIWWPLSFTSLVINISKEQSFRDVFEPIGDFIAFGKPKEKMRPLGASRIYAGGDWMQEVTDYMARARLVIVRPGEVRAFNEKSSKFCGKFHPSESSFTCGSAAGRIKNRKHTKSSVDRCRDYVQRNYPSS